MSGREGEPETSRWRGSEAQRVGGHHAAVLHHGGADGSQVVEELLGLARAQSLDVGQDPLVRLEEESGQRDTLRSARAHTPAFHKINLRRLCKRVWQKQTP